MYLLWNILYILILYSKFYHFIVSGAWGTLIFCFLSAYYFMEEYFLECLETYYSKVKLVEHELWKHCDNFQQKKMWVFYKQPINIFFKVFWAWISLNAVGVHLNLGPARVSLWLQILSKNHYYFVLFVAGDKRHNFL